MADPLPYALRIWVSGRYGMVRQQELDSNKLYTREHVAIVKLDVMPHGRIRATAHSWEGKGGDEANNVACVSYADKEGMRHDPTMTLIKETQGFETALFRSYFRQRGLFLLRGARPLTTVNKAEGTATPRFFRVKGSSGQCQWQQRCSVLQGNEVFIPRPAGAKCFYIWRGSRSTECDQDVGANLLFGLGRYGGAPPPMYTHGFRLSQRHNEEASHPPYRTKRGESDARPPKSQVCSTSLCMTYDIALICAITTIAPQSLIGSKQIGLYERHWSCWIYSRYQVRYTTGRPSQFHCGAVHVQACCRLSPHHPPPPPPPPVRFGPCWSRLCLW
jgi:hypothetical protein